MNNSTAFRFPIGLAYTLSVAVVEAIQHKRSFVGKNDLRRLLEWYQNAAYPWNAALFSREGTTDEGQALYILMRHVHSKNAVNGVRQRVSLANRVAEFMSRFPRDVYSHHDFHFVLDFFNDLSVEIAKYRRDVGRRKRRARAGMKIAHIKSRMMHARI